MPDLDRVKPTLDLAQVRTLVDAVSDQVVPALNEAWHRGDLPDADLLVVQSAARHVRGAVERSHRARTAATTRPPGPKLTRVPGVAFDPDTGTVGTTGGLPVYVFARPGQVDDA